jgi:hypothetical protein
MSETEEAPRPPRKPRADKGRKRNHVPRPSPAPGSKALDQIDSRLAEAIAEHAHAVKQLASLDSWQRRANVLQQEIDQLIDYSCRLRGQDPPPSRVHPVDPMQVLEKTMAASSQYDFRNPIPEGVGSIPAGERVKGPRPTSGNVSEIISGEGGFS